MIAQAINLMNFLKGPKQFIIPFYQRTYSNPVYNSPEFVGIKSEAGLLLRFRTFALLHSGYTQSFERIMDNGGAVNV
jgi:hypothetical protein